MAGREREWADVRPAKLIKKVVVIGGGPAGMEAARVAAERGHHVTLFERSDRLGGQVNLIMALPDRDDFGEIVSFFEGQLRQSNVKVKLGIEASVDTVLEENPDAVIVATGSSPFKPQIPGSDGRHVVTPPDVLDGSALVGDNVVVIDTQGLRPGSDIANFLVRQGKKVEIVTGLPYVGCEIQAGVWRMLHEELLSRSVVMSPFTGVWSIGESSVETYNTIYTAPSTVRVIEGVDTVVLAAGGKAEDGLYKELQGKISEVYAVGDCLQPRDVEAAVYEGHKAGRAV